jgi:hypothetical protein
MKKRRARGGIIKDAEQILPPSDGRSKRGWGEIIAKTGRADTGNDAGNYFDQSKPEKAL